MDAQRRDRNNRSPQRVPLPVFHIAILLLLTAGLTAAEHLRPQVTLLQRADGVVFTLDLTDVNAADWQRVLAAPDRFAMAGYGIDGRPGDPALPAVTELLRLEKEEGADLEILASEWLEIDPPALKAANTGHLERQPPNPFESYIPSDSLRESMPEVRIGEPVILRGRRYLPLTIRPVKLDPVTAEVTVLRRLQGLIPGAELPAAMESPREVIDPAAYGNDLGRYLVITPPLFEPYLTPWIEWKQRKGHPVSVANTQETGSYAGGVKDYIQTAYETWEDPPDYVVLVGDVDQGMPAFYVQNPDGYFMVTDHPYACLEGDDVFPEVHVGRFSVDTGSELLAVVYKQLAYEMQPYMDDPDWFRRGLMLCTTLGAASTRQTKNWVRRKLLENGFVQVDTVYHPDQYGSSGVYEALNEGVGFVNYRGYGMWHAWSGPHFYNSSIYNLNNGAQLPIITSIVCGGGDFANSIDPCFGEAWLRAGTIAVPQGAVAFFGPSEIDTHTQFNNVIDIGIYYGIFDLGIQTLGPAMWQGKFELWQNYYQNQYHPFGQTPEFYLHVYNLLGDPGLQMWTDTPRAIAVNHPDTLRLNDDHLLVTVEDADGMAVADAAVSILVGDESRVRFSDATGQVLLPLGTYVADEVLLTVTGRNLHPYLATIPIAAEAYPFSLVDCQISGSGLLSAGSTHNLDLSLTNGPADVTEATLTLRVPESGSLTVVDSIITLVDLQAGETRLLQEVFSFTTDAGATHGEWVSLQFAVEFGSQTWTWQRVFPIQAPDLVIADIPVLTGIPAAGETVQIALAIHNQGGVASSDLTLELLPHELLTFSGGTLSCSAVPVDGTVQTSDGISVTLSDQIFPGEGLEVAWRCIQEQRIDTLITRPAIGEISVYGPSAPDAYGYRLFDDRDLAYSEAPVFHWLEIDPNYGGAGEWLEIRDVYEETDAAEFVELPFPVTYYGETFTTATVSSNGWIALGGSPEVGFHNRAIPSPAGPDAMIAPLWDDLVTDPGAVYHYTTPDNALYIIQWSRMSHLQLANQLTFQVIFHNTDHNPTQTGDTEITFQYQDYRNDDFWANFATVGIEAPDVSTGIQASYNSIDDASLRPLGNRRVLRFTTDRGQRLPDPAIEIDVTDLHFEQNPWSQTLDSITISNTGEAPLLYDIHLEAPAQIERGSKITHLQEYRASKTGAEPQGGERQTRSQGSDLFGHVWRDSQEEDGPTFQWVDIERPELALSYAGIVPDDIGLGPLGLGFGLPLYDDCADSIFISTNGTISLTSPAEAYFNFPLPHAAAPPALIAPWWDDLNNDADGIGTIYYYSNGLDSAVVTWSDFHKWTEYHRYTFQVILTPFGELTYQYLSMDGTLTNATVGIQDQGRTQGMTIVFNQEHDLSSGTAVKIRRPDDWLGLTSLTGRIEPGESRTLTVLCNSRDLWAGNQAKVLLFETNVPDMPALSIPVDLEVVLGDLPAGDISGDYQVNVQDLINLLDFILLIADPDNDQFARADLVVDGHLNIQDAVIVIDLILGRDD